MNDLLAEAKSRVQGAWHILRHGESDWATGQIIYPIGDERTPGNEIKRCTACGIPRGTVSHGLHCMSGNCHDPDAGKVPTAEADIDADNWRGGVPLNRLARLLFEIDGGGDGLWDSVDHVSQEVRSKYFALARDVLTVGAPHIGTEWILSHGSDSKCRHCEHGHHGYTICRAFHDDDNRCECIGQSGRILPECTGHKGAP